MADAHEDRHPVVRGRFRIAWRVVIAAATTVAIVSLAACEPSAPPGFSATPAATSGSGATGSASPDGSALVAGSPTVTVNGATVRIVGLSSGNSPDFELPAGSAAMTVSICKSNGVIPFVTLFDASGTKLGIIVEPEYQIKNLVGGKYHVEVVSNPDCAWTIEVTPA